MTIDLSVFVAIVVPTVFGIVWLVRLEGRINVTESRYDEILKRLERIERNQDAMRVG